MNKILPLLAVLVLSFAGLAQKTVATYPTLTANNGTSAVTFEAVNTSDIDILSMECAITTGTHGFQVWYRPGGVLHPSATTPNVSPANGWVLHETVNVTSTSTTIPTNVVFTNPLNLPAGTYGFAVGGSSVVRYMTYSAAVASTYTDGTLTLNTGVGNGFGGGIPSPTIATRSFVGSVTYREVSKALNDAGVTQIDSPVTFCAGAQNIVATIKNFGINQINSVIINWKFNGITQTPVSYNQTLDTLNGTGNNTAQVFLGSKTFTSGVTSLLEVWTSNPNNMTDTANGNDSAITGIQPSLSGTFTIDPSGSGTNNYLSFSDAVNDLNQFGVCGACTFNVKEGTYAEQVAFDAISGTSATNTITFRPNTSNTAPVLLNFNASTANNFIMNFTGTNYVTIQGIQMTNTGTYGTTVNLANGASNNTFRNCKMTGNLSTTTTSNLYATIYANGAGFENNSFIEDTIIGGSMGIYYYSASSIIFNPGMIAEGNVIEGPYYMGMYIYGHTGTRIAYNTVYSQSSYTSGYGIYSYYGGEGSQVISNKIITMNMFDWPLYGIAVGYNTASDTARGVVANNMVHVGTPSSTGTKYGMYFYGNINSDLVYNSIAVEGTSTSARAGYVWINGLGNRVLNNNFMHYGDGYGLYTSSTYAPVCDNNNITSSGSRIGFWNTDQATLSNWITAGGGNNTISADSLYVNLDSLRTCDTALFAKGMALEDIVVDYDGDFRNPASPNIGADEYVASAELFTIGDTINFCGGDEVVIGTTMNDATFLWSTSETTPTITVSAEGNYSVIVDGPCATGMTDDVEVVDVNPVASFTVSAGNFLRGFDNTSEYGTSYFWEFGDGATSTEVNPFHVYPSNGTYTVTLTVMNYCDTLTSTQNISVTVGLNEFSFDNNISIYPNPANEVININIGELKDQIIQMQIVDMKGQVHINDLIKVTQGGVEQINVSSLSKGIYLIRLSGEGEVATRQIVVQ